MSAGFDPDRFWAQTPASHASAMRGAANRLRREGERDVALSHTIALFGRVKRLEPVERYLPRTTPSKGPMLDKLKRIAVATEHLA